ncbi:TetR/AcrR family transcriptional regulator [Curtobacterium sp. Leaf261]|uniref:TetR/AcrR family transcriptional regulator n=1 Tax=Curtobacterium sp. Leaf261 TaxID=1736311 RepID=UPI0006FDD456|nr:TetR/AcrR family transcriptional regulator [Curtobacterium sp. Leaf261]KQO61503.1 TetR family transcriptional regulator [Curtobacterium sp. Leaf261]
MTPQPFHHGNLRAELLDQAEALLRDSGVDGLSLRELARRAGVSHGAPRSHFVDRQALLDALAERGFMRLTEDVRSALATEGLLADRLVRVGQAYVDFAVADAALMELMFAVGTSAPTRPVQDAAARLFAVLDGVIGTHRKLLFAATLQGISTFVSGHRVTPAQGESLVRDAVSTMLGAGPTGPVT